MAGTGTKGLCLADMLFELGAVKFATKPGEFRLKLHEKTPDAPLSPIYLDLRTSDHPTKPGPLTFEAMELIGDLLFQVLAAEGISYKRFVAIPDAGNPFADQISRLWDGLYDPPTRLSLTKVVDEEGNRHIGDTVEGVYEPGDTVLLIDDLITWADTKLEAIRALEAKGLVVVCVIVLVDRMQGGREELEKAGYRVLSIHSLERLLLRYVNTSRLELSKADEVRQYVAGNRVTVSAQGEA